MAAEPVRKMARDYEKLKFDSFDREVVEKSKRVLGVRARVFSAARLHGDDTTVPVLAKGRTRIGRVWGYVRDDRPFGGPDPPAVAFFYSPDRRGEHPQRHLASFAGILQADAYAGFDRLYPTGRGLFDYASRDEALAAIDAIAADYGGHSRAAREVARDVFGADRVIGRLLTEIGL